MRNEWQSTKCADSATNFCRGRKSPCLKLLPNAIHFWFTVDLEWHADRRLTFCTDEEIARARRIQSKEGCVRFAGGRAFAREVLSWYVGKKPEDILMTTNSYGRPEIAQTAFSLAHGRNSALLAVTSLPSIGVDMEEKFFSGITADPSAILPFLHAGERALFAKDIDGDAALRLWVRKEAVVKACGKSILNCAPRIMALPDERDETVYCLDAEGHAVSRWHCPLKEEDGCVIAYAYREQDVAPCTSWFIFPHTRVT